MARLLPRDVDSDDVAAAVKGGGLSGQAGAAESFPLFDVQPKHMHDYSVFDLLSHAAEGESDVQAPVPG